MAIQSYVVDKLGIRGHDSILVTTNLWEMLHLLQMNRHSCSNDVVISNPNNKSQYFSLLWLVRYFNAFSDLDKIKWKSTSLKVRRIFFTYAFWVLQLAWSYGWYILFMWHFLKSQLTLINFVLTYRKENLRYAIDCFLEQY